MVKYILLVATLLLTGCNIIIIKHEEGNLPRVELKDNTYFCKNGKTKVDVDSDELIVTCKIKI